MLPVGQPRASLRATCDDRMKVRGQDDLARLATSMNYMASELEKQITHSRGACQRSSSDSSPMSPTSCVRL